jgi:predicted RNA-binding protein associated with RNAse of E/G family
MPHQGTVTDVAARVRYDRAGRPNTLTACIPGSAGLYVAGAITDHPRITAFEQWLLPGEGWVVGRFRVHPGQPPARWDWYVDIDAVEVDGARWYARDRLLDLTIFEGQRYEVHDLDEFADAVEGGHLSAAESLATLRSLDRLCRAVRDTGFSGQGLLERYAPDLPRP